MSRGMTVWQTFDDIFYLCSGEIFSQGSKIMLLKQGY